MQNQRRAGRFNAFERHKRDFSRTQNFFRVQNLKAHRLAGWELSAFFDKHVVPALRRLRNGSGALNYRHEF